MKLVLYSGGQSRRNHKLHRAVVDLALKDKRGSKSFAPLQFTYIPYCSDQSNIYFERIMRRFRAHGVERFFCLNVDQPLHRHEIALALESDIIYLAGGNTFYFLKHLRRTGMLSKLEKFAKRGGVLAGLSAGALIMSPTVKSAAEPALDPDENEVNLKNLKGMGLFPFEFSPHFDGKKSEVRAHLNYSKKTRYPVLAVEDGGGIVIDGKAIYSLGRVEVFQRGRLIDDFDWASLTKRSR